MSDRLKKKLSYFLSLTCMIVVLMGIAYVGFLRTIEIDIMENVSLEYTGENGAATLRVRNSNNTIDQRAAALMETVKYQADPNSNLSNGDTVTITATYDRSMARQYNFKIKKTKEKIKVEGLPDQYESLADIDATYLETIQKAAMTYIDEQSERIYRVEVDEQADHPHLESKTVLYSAFLKSKEKGTSDRVMDLVRLDYTVNEQVSSLYYLVIVPEINTDQEVNEQDIYGQKAMMSTQEENEQDYASYVERIFSDNYTIEVMDSSTQE